MNCLQLQKERSVYLIFCNIAFAELTGDRIFFIEFLVGRSSAKEVKAKSSQLLRVRMNLPH